MVTTDWWDNTWLDEGLIKYFEYLGVHETFPEYNANFQFVHEILHHAMRIDASPHSHPLTTSNIFNYDDIKDTFSTLTSYKGAALIRTLHLLMKRGDTDHFRDGIREYLKENQFSTVKPEDLIVALRNRIESVPVREIITMYTNQKGFPLVTVKREGEKLTLTQKKFSYDLKEEDDGSTWEIPITISTSGYHTAIPLHGLQYFPMGKKEIVVTIPENSPVIVLNNYGLGYYRVNYPTENWLHLKNILPTYDYGNIYRLSRVQIINDLFELARAGHHTYEFVFDILTNYIKTEIWWEPMHAFLDNLEFLSAVAAPNDQSLFYSFAAELLQPVFNVYNNQTGYSYNDRILRVRLYNLACKYGVDECLELADEQSKKILMGQNIEPDLRPMVYCTNVRNTPTLYTTLWDQYLKEENEAGRSTLLNAMGCVRAENYINVSLNYSYVAFVGLYLNHKN